MEKETKIAILMQDGCTKKEAEDHLRKGAVIFDSEIEDREGLEMCLAGDPVTDEEWAGFEQMFETKKPLPDWGAVKFDGKTYYIMYVL